LESIFDQLVSELFSSCLNEISLGGQTLFLSTVLQVLCDSVSHEGQVCVYPEQGQQSGCSRVVGSFFGCRTNLGYTGNAEKNAEQKREKEREREREIDRERYAAL
jgi:hypothetical protein